MVFEVSFLAMFDPEAGRNFNNLIDVLRFTLPLEEDEDKID